MDIIWVVILILLLFWLSGYFVFSAGALIHILIVVAIILLIYKLITGRNP